MKNKLESMSVKAHTLQRVAVTHESLNMCSSYFQFHRNLESLLHASVPNCYFEVSGKIHFLSLERRFEMCIKT